MQPPRIAITTAPDQLENPEACRTYRTAVERAGGKPELIAGVERGKAGALLADFDGLLLPGGTDLDPETYGGRPHPAVDVANPRRDELELEAARFARRSGLPLLAICRGMQVANVALGGTLFEDIPDQYEAPNGLKLRHHQTRDLNRSRKETTHPVDLLAGSAIADIAGSASIATNTMHHQAVRRVAYPLVATAHARDGIVEALELRGEHPFFIAVQWHPEELVENDEPSRRLFERFVQAAAARARGRSSVGAAR
ncbi:MAG TPA: gamma-glutamyl-gamma-aminobutyrate hydrolase family protein [Candidatus Eremiobacteraceae bacterium]|nr:gamma-glutamyl-gamma-aminobutyrate hydrolase family protein [Candidatus Eremiobacteraceae bacterium]